MTYQNTPAGMHFVRDAYQAEVMLAAMGGMERKGDYPQYQRSANHPVLRVLGFENERWEPFRRLGASLEKPVGIRPVTPGELDQDGFVMLARKNVRGGEPNVFEKMRDHIMSVLSPEERERMEDDMELCSFLRELDVKEAQGKVLEKAASLQS